MGYRKLVAKLREEVEKRFVGNREAIRGVTLGLLSERSTILIRGPRGRGKSTLMLLFLKGIFGDDYVVISGASEVKRGEVVARLHLPSLEKEGVERVVWSAFVKAKGKGIDEVNRLNPYTAANIYHMLQFGEVWAYGKRYLTRDFVLIANENPGDPTTFTHPPPFYDRFDVSVYLRSLSLSEKFELQKLLEKTSPVDDMPQVLSFEDLKEAREEVAEVELDVEIMGTINVLVRDLQACVRGRDYSPIKPPALCEGCHFVRGVCSAIKEGPSERATVVLTNLAKAKAWLEGKVDVSDIYELALLVLPHRMELVREGLPLAELREILRREEEINRERESRGQWFLLDKLLKGFKADVYRLAREIAMEDLVFAEELIKLEGKWVKEGAIKPEETLGFEIL